MSRHLALPLRLGAGGSFVTVPEDSLDEVAQSVAVVLLTRLGERPATPTLGTPDPTFAGLDADAALELVSEWEPRADLELVEQTLDADGVDRSTVRVRRREDS